MIFIDILLMMGGDSSSALVMFLDILVVMILDSSPEWVIC